MEKEFNLSKHVGRSTILANTIGIDEEWWYPEKKVKEFIKRLKHALKYGIKGATHMSEPELIKNELIIIDKLAGDKLT